MTLFGDRIIMRPSVSGLISPGVRYGAPIDTRGYSSMRASVAMLGVLADQPTDTIDFDLLHSPPPIVGAANPFPGIGDGTPIDMRRGIVPGIEEVAVPFTVPVNCTAFRASFWLSRIGVPQSSSPGIIPSVSAKIYGDSGGSPLGAVDGVTFKYRSIELLRGLTKIELVFEEGGAVSLLAGIPYWLAIDAITNKLSDTDFVRCHARDVAGTSGCKKRESFIWSAIPNQDIWFEIEYLTYGPIPPETGWSTINWVASELYMQDLIDRVRDINLELVNQYFQVRTTVSAGSWWAGSFIALLGDPVSRPPVDDLYS
jgi:hypothetical protein